MSRNRRIVIAAAVAAVLLGAPGGAWSQTQVTQAMPDTMAAFAELHPGDAIRLGFWRDQDVSGDYPVDEDGNAVLPFIGTRHVVGMGYADMKDRLRADFSTRLRNQEISITPLKRVRVLGFVNRPGIYHVDPTMTLGDALALAEGTREDGDTSDIRILRNGSEILTGLDLLTPLADRVRSGDQILIEQKGWLTRNATFLIGTASSIAVALIYQGLRN